MTWRINKAGEREQIKTNLGDIWKDGREWKVKFPNGIITTKTKKRAKLWAATL